MVRRKDYIVTSPGVHRLAPFPVTLVTEKGCGIQVASGDYVPATPTLFCFHSSSPFGFLFNLPSLREAKGNPEGYPFVLIVGLFSIGLSTISITRGFPTGYRV
jgi:hypothetical protein